VATAVEIDWSEGHLMQCTCRKDCDRASEHGSEIDNHRIAYQAEVTANFVQMQRA
jgi:hypothetical protein